MIEWDAAGYRLLIQVHDVEEADDTYKRAKMAGIVLAKDATDRDQHGMDKGQVVKVGKLAYSGYDEPWCKEGDTVMFPKYSGVVFEDKETETLYRFINDDEVFGVIEA